MTIAYAYARFSSHPQGEGHSLERQMDKAARYAANHGLTLDQELTLHDLGVSARHMRNAKTGALSVFLQAVEQGRVPRGSYFLIENADRLTRADIPDAMQLFLSIINSGIVVVTLTNEQQFSRDTLSKDPQTILYIVLELIRANQESVRKGQLVADAREKKRRAFVSGERTGLYTRQTPAWIGIGDDRRTLHLIEDRAVIVKSILAKADQGWSPDRIARSLNADGVETWAGRRKAGHWRGSYIVKILRNRACIGTFTPSRTTRDEATGARRDVPQEGIENYFPPVTDRGTFERISARMATTAPRGRNAGKATTSLFAGVIKCKACGSTVTRLSKGDYVYLVCSKAHARGQCDYKAVPYANAEMAVRDNADALVNSAPQGDAASDAAADDIFVLEELIPELQDQLATRFDELAASKSPEARRAVQQKQRELKDASRQLRLARERRERHGRPFVQARLKALRDALKQEPFDVMAVNAVLREAVERIDLDPSEGKMWWHWRDASAASEPDYVVVQSRHWKPFG